MECQWSRGSLFISVCKATRRGADESVDDVDVVALIDVDALDGLPVQGEPGDRVEEDVVVDVLRELAAGDGSIDDLDALPTACLLYTSDAADE